MQFSEMDVTTYNATRPGLQCQLKKLDITCIPALYRFVKIKVHNFCLIQQTHGFFQPLSMSEILIKFFAPHYIQKLIFCFTRKNENTQICGTYECLVRYALKLEKPANKRIGVCHNIHGIPLFTHKAFKYFGS